VDLSAYAGKTGALAAASAPFYDHLGAECSVTQDAAGIVSINVHDVQNPDLLDGPDFAASAWDSGVPYTAKAKKDSTTFTQKHGDVDLGWCSDWWDTTTHDLKTILVLKPGSVEIRSEWRCGMPTPGHRAESTVCAF
jgi:hypothetical protein